jgi:hypothetical protein
MNLYIIAFASLTTIALIQIAVIQTIATLGHLNNVKFLKDESCRPSAAEVINANRSVAVSQFRCVSPLRIKIN